MPEINPEIQNCKTAKTLVPMDGQILDGHPLLTMSLSLTKALFLESVETGAKQHTAQFVADELEQVAKVWCPAMTGDRNTMIGIDANCLYNPSLNKFATSPENIGIDSNSSDQGGSNQVPVLSNALAGTSSLPSTSGSSIQTQK